MNGKPVYYRKAKTVLNTDSRAFQEKKLCDGLTLNGGDACVASCTYCYVGPMLLKLLFYVLSLIGALHAAVVIRRSEAARVLKTQLTDKKGRSRYQDSLDTRVVYSSTTVDCAGNLTLARETAEMATMIFAMTNWQVRLLTKFNLFPKLVAMIPAKYHQRLILGVSTGTLDDGIAAAIEPGTARVSKRLESLYWLQDRGFRTFGMICPSLPQVDYMLFARHMAAAIRVERCEHVWAEVINLRGDSFTRTIEALACSGLTAEAFRLARVHGPGSAAAWENYARETFLAHKCFIPPEKLRYLQYVSRASAPWWSTQEKYGAIMLGKQAL